ncbi:uncharacterized protein [Rutidosis leptorrhynchoides]|uniref:uncharacterized protein n=1 Tax=Rutidosis leptorrhynchoides TaxID=125765 RepID=UPI003A98F984
MKICRKLEARYLHTGYTLIQFFKPLFVDLSIRLSYDFVLKGGFSSVLESCSSTLKLVDTELGFLYDEIYTKRPFLNTFAGVSLRCISFLCSFSALAAFSVIVTVDTAPKQHSTLDIGISFMLLVGAVALEIYSIITHCLSDWGLVWATKTDNFLSCLICKANACKLTWNRGNVQDTTMLNIPQYNFINYLLKTLHFPFVKKGWHSFLFYLAVKDNFWIDWWCTTWEKIDWEKSLQTHLDKQYIYIQSQSVEVRQHEAKDFNLWMLFEKRFRGEGDEDIKEVMMRSVGIGDCIFILHLATDICYHVDSELCNFNNRDDYTTSKLLSDYMLYILMSLTSMLVEKGNKEFPLFLSIRMNLNTIIHGSKYLDVKIDNVRTLSSLLLASGLEGYGDLMMFDIVKLARWLQQEWGVEERWSLISEVWVETLTHVAMHCPGKEHLKCLGRGGDLVSKVSLVMMHYGLCPRIHLVPNVQTI